MIVAIIISVIALIISIISYFKDRSIENIEVSNMPNWEYTDNGITFYDKSGKKILIKGE